MKAASLGGTFIASIVGVGAKLAQARASNIYLSACGFFASATAQTDVWVAKGAADGLKQGVTLFATETGKPLPGESHPSYSNIQRAGFAIAYERANWTL